MKKKIASLVLGIIMAASLIISTNTQGLSNYAGNDQGTPPPLRIIAPYSTDQGTPPPL